MSVGVMSSIFKDISASFLSIIPAWLQVMFFGRPMARPLVFSEKVQSLTDEKNKYIAPVEWLDRTPDTQGSQESEVIDISIPPDRLLHRKLDIPKASLRKLDQVVALDTLHKTPFKPSDIYHTFRVNNLKGNQAYVDQWIARKADIDILRRRFSDLGLNIRRVEVAGEVIGPIADFSAQIAPHGKIWLRINAALIVMIIVAGISLWARPAWTTYQALQQQEAELDILRSQAVLLRRDVEALRDGAAERAAFLDRLTQRSILSSAIRDLSIVLPDEVWITDLSFQPTRVNLRGSINGSAAQLVLDLTDKRQFTNPRLSGPVSQTSDGRERFDLTLDLNQVAR